MTMSLKVGFLPYAVGKQPSIYMITLGVTLADDLTFHDHVSEVISSGAS